MALNVNYLVFVSVPFVCSYKSYLVIIGCIWHQLGWPLWEVELIAFAAQNGNK